LSKKPESQRPSVSSVLPARNQRGSYAPLMGVYSIGRSHESTEGRIGSGAPRDSGTNESHWTMLRTPSRSLAAVRCDTPFLYMI